MSKKIAPRVQLNFAPEEVIDTHPVTGEENPNFIYEEEEELSLPVSMPEVIERKEIIENDIFDNVSTATDVNPSLNGLNEDLIINEIHDEPPSVRSRTKPRKKTGRKLSEEHAAKLALAREKALATRRANAEEKKRMKEIENKTKELKKKKAVKELEELKDEVDNTDKPVKSTPSVNQQSVNMFSKKDLEDAQLEAIIKYETIRKARKEEKKKQQMIDQQKEQLKQKIAGYGAKDTNGRLINRWDRCY